MHFVDILRRRGLARADRPDRFIGDGEFLACIFDVGERGLDLLFHELDRAALIAGLLAFAAAQYHAQTCCKRGFDLGLYQGIALCVVAAPLAVAQDDELCAGVRDHCRRDIASVCAAVGKVAILSADADLTCLAVDWMNQCVWRRNCNLHFHVTLGRAVHRARLREHCPRAMHLPVSNNIGPFSHRIVLRLF